jgi:hypothetical protein
VSPVALGDGPLWIEGQPDESVFSLYGAAHVGIFGAVIRETNVSKILKLDCLATDFYRGDAFPTYLIYNPYEEDKIIDYSINGGAVKLFDALTRKIVSDVVSANFELSIPARSARLIVEIPANAKISTANGHTYADGVVIAY